MVSGAPLVRDYDDVIKNSLTPLVFLLYAIKRENCRYITGGRYMTSLPQFHGKKGFKDVVSFVGV